MTEPVTPPSSRQQAGWGILRAIVRSPLGLASLIWLALIIAAAVLAPVLPLPSPIAQDLTATLQGPGLEHLLGTDTLGRDVLSRLVFGARTALIGGLVATSIALVLGGTLGVIAGWSGGWIDAAGSRVAELIFSLPAIVILLTFAAIFGRNMNVSMVVFGVLMSPAFLRLAQMSSRSVRRELYIDAARISGVSTRRIVVGDVLPNVVGPLIVQSSLTFGASLLVMSSLGFLGLGPPPPAPEWGTMIAEASSEIFRFPWLLIPTGVVLSATILSANLIGDVIRDGDKSKRRVSMLPRRSGRGAKRPSPAVQDEPRNAATPSDSVLQVADLAVSFPTPEGEHAVVDGVGFDLRRSEILGLVGESGSGKTMTALSILGLVPAPGRVAAGSITLEGTDLVRASEKSLQRLRGREIGMISQEPMVALDPSFTVRSQMIPVLRRIRGISGKEAIGCARELLADVGLPDPDAVLRSYPFQLSGGMAQRVSIALALVGDPKILIADEPTTALDVTVQAGILDLVRDLARDRSMSVLLVTHDLGVVADLCDRTIVMEKGRIVEEASVTDLFKDPRHEYTKKLIASTPSLIEGAT